jgi:hypothetical protein
VGGVRRLAETTTSHDSITTSQLKGSAVPTVASVTRGLQSRTALTGQQVTVRVRVEVRVGIRVRFGGWFGI